MSATRCPDAHGGACRAHAVWSSKRVTSITGYAYRLDKGVFSKVESDNSFAYSVRCVKDL